MPLHSRIPIQGQFRKLPEARGLFRSPSARGYPSLIWYEGRLYIRHDLPVQELQVLLTDFRRMAGDAPESGPRPGLRPFGKGDLERALEKIIAQEVSLVKGEHVPQETLTKIVRLLREAGWDAKRPSVRAKLVGKGYHGKRPQRFI